MVCTRRYARQHGNGTCCLLYYAFISCCLLNMLHHHVFYNYNNNREASRFVFVTATNYKPSSSISWNNISPKKDMMKNTKKLDDDMTSVAKSDDIITPSLQHHQHHRGGGGTFMNVTPRDAVRLGMILAFNSGYINGCCLSGNMILSGTKQVTVAVTGAWSNSAIGLASSNYILFKTQLRMIVSYMIGSILVSTINPYPQLYYISDSIGSITFLLGGLILYLSSQMASFNRDQLCFNLAAMANGIQNSYTSVHTSNLIRSTHYTGMTSDIGTYIGQILRGNYQNISRLQTFLLLSISFWFGGYISYSITKFMKSDSLLLSSLLYVVIGLSFILRSLYKINNTPFVSNKKIN